MTDIVEQLRNPMWAHSNAPFESPQLEQEENLAVMNMAADEIEDLTKANQILQALIGNRDKEVERLRAALVRIEQDDRMWTSYPDHHEVLATSTTGNKRIRGRCGRIAHAALQSPADHSPIENKETSQ